MISMKLKWPPEASFVLIKTRLRLQHVSSQWQHFHIVLIFIASWGGLLDFKWELPIISLTKSFILYSNTIYNLLILHNFKTNWFKNQARKSSPMVVCHQTSLSRYWITSQLSYSVWNRSFYSLRHIEDGGKVTETPDIWISGATVTLTSASGCRGVNSARLGDRQRCKGLNSRDNVKYFIIKGHLTHLCCGWMDSNKIIKVRLGCSHFKSHAKALCNFSRIWSQVVETNYFLLKNN